jgi:hypothetical protein
MLQGMKRTFAAEELESSSPLDEAKQSQFILLIAV